MAGWGIPGTPRVAKQIRSPPKGKGKNARDNRGAVNALQSTPLQTVSGSTVVLGTTHMDLFEEPISVPSGDPEAPLPGLVGFGNVSAYHDPQAV